MCVAHLCCLFWAEFVHLSLCISSYCIVSSHPHPYVWWREIEYIFYIWQAKRLGLGESLSLSFVDLVAERLCVIVARRLNSLQLLTKLILTLLETCIPHPPSNTQTTQGSSSFILHQFPFLPFSPSPFFFLLRRACSKICCAKVCKKPFFILVLPIRNGNPLSHSLLFIPSYTIKPCRAEATPTWKPLMASR